MIQDVYKHRFLLLKLILYKFVKDVKIYKFIIELSKSEMDALVATEFKYSSYKTGKINYNIIL